MMDKLARINQSLSFSLNIGFGSDDLFELQHRFICRYWDLKFEFAGSYDSVISAMRRAP